jgi:hypothetical protein
LSVDISFDDGVPVVVRMLDRRLAQDIARIIDQNVDPRHILFHLFDESVQIVPLGKIAGVTAEGTAEGGHFLFDPAAGGFQTGTDAHDVRAGFRKSESHAFSDTAFTAGHQCGFTFEGEWGWGTHSRHPEARLSIPVPGGIRRLPIFGDRRCDAVQDGFDRDDPPYRFQVPHSAFSERLRNSPLLFHSNDPW